jgi:hypothetical protein
LENLLISSSTQFQYLKTTPQSDLIQNKLIPASLGTVPEIIDPVFAKTSQNARFLLSEYERFGLVFTKTRVYKFGHGLD